MPLLNTSAVIQAQGVMRRQYMLYARSRCCKRKRVKKWWDAQYLTKWP